MLRRLRPKLTYANVIATLALFIALGSGSYAALRVGTKQIANNSVRSVDLRDNDVRSRDIRNGSLLAKDFARAQLPAGPVGPAGPAGPPGPAGPRPDCPSGMILHEFVCIESAARPATTWELADSACTGINRRLPTTAELLTVRARPDIDLGDGNWSTDIHVDDGAVRATSVGEAGIINVAGISGPTERPSRCVEAA